MIQYKYYPPEAIFIKQLSAKCHDITDICLTATRPNAGGHHVSFTVPTRSLIQA